MKSMKFNFYNLFSLLSFLLVTLAPLMSAALTTFGKTPNSGGSARPCNTDGDCSSIKYSSCARDPSTSRKLCLCPDSRTPIGNSCDQIPTALHLPCEKDEQCIPHAACVLNNTIGAKVCMCRDNATEVGNICNGSCHLGGHSPLLVVFGASLVVLYAIMSTGLG